MSTDGSAELCSRQHPPVESIELSILPSTPIVPEHLILRWCHTTSTHPHYHRTCKAAHSPPARSVPMLQASTWRQTAPWRRRHSTQAPQQRRSSRIFLRVSSMFTGIVQGTAEVANVDRRSNFSQLQISFPAGRMADVQLGASVAINGTCLTVTDVQHDTVSFDVMMETLRATSLGELAEGSHVNFERSARVGDEIGGHNVSGHVHCKARVAAVEDSPNNRRLVFELPDDRWMKYILPKGFIAVDGCSLTVGEVEDNTFSVYLIPETMRVTIFGSKKQGDSVNIEIEAQTQAIVDTVERVLEQRLGASTVNVTVR